MDREIHWDLLRRPLLVFLFCTVVSGALIFYSTARYNEIADSFSTERQSLQRFARDYRTAIQEEELYKTYVDQYELFIEQGYIDNEPRLEWIEALQQINQQLKLPVMKYTIKPRKEFELRNINFSINDQISIFESPMHLDMGLLHEGDLFEFFRLLDEKTGGLYEVRGCDIRTSDSGIDTSGEKSNLDARCLLSWYTMDVETNDELLAEQ
ncbi:MAG: hypothetical protein AAF434_02255 [Pseudomonadota bacterium]